MTPGRRRVAAIDIGTNTVLMLVADVTAHGLEPVVDRATITRLGEGVDRTRRISEVASARTLSCLERYAEELLRLRVDRVAAVGTSALRDADGGAEFLDAAEGALGTRPRVIDGKLEAALTCQGALSGLQPETIQGASEAGAPPSGSVVVFDVGGGSTELVETSTDGGRVRSWQSLDIGSVRLSERCLRSDPPAPEELREARTLVRQALGAWQRAKPDRVVGVAGTVTTLSALAQKLPRYDPARVQGSRLALRDAAALAGRLAQMSSRERASIPALEPGRADVIVAGALLVEELLGHLGAVACQVSERGVRWGLAERLATGDW